MVANDGGSSLDMRRLTPLDVHNKEFKKSFRGYDEDEVDEFLDLVVAEFERIVRHNEDLQGSISGLESRLEHYKGLEETLKNAILLAQKAADEIRESARREAAMIEKEANARAQRLKIEAKEALEDSYREIERTRDLLRRFHIEMRAFLQSTLEYVSKGSEDLELRLGEERQVVPDEA